MYANMNEVILKGVVLEEAEYSHVAFHKTFYMIKLGVARFSGEIDEIPVLIEYNIYDVFSIKKDQWLTVKGCYRSCNKWDDNGTHLILSVYAFHIEANEDRIYKNTIFLDGYICKTPNWRETPLKREITDLLVAANRPFGKSDYIPCICWQRNARMASSYTIGSHVHVTGRIQSREYLKRYADGSEEWKTAYEVSVSELNLVEAVDEGNASMEETQIGEGV